MYFKISHVSGKKHYYLFLVYKKVLSMVAGNKYLFKNKFTFKILISKIM